MTNWFKSHASKDARIATQAATIRELTDKLAVAEGRYNAQSVHLRQVEGQRDTAYLCRDDLAAKVAKQEIELAKYRPARDPKTQRLVGKTSQSAIQTAPAGMLIATASAGEGADA